MRTWVGLSILTELLFLLYKMEKELRFLNLLLTSRPELYTPFRMSVLRELWKVDFNAPEKRQLLMYDPDTNLKQWNVLYSPLQLEREEGCVFVNWDKPYTHAL